MILIKVYKQTNTNQYPQTNTFRSSHRRCSVLKDVLRNLIKLSGKNMCQSLYFNKVAGLRPATLLNRDPDTGFFL